MDVTTVRQAQHVADQAMAWLGRMRASFALPRDVPHWEIPGNSLKALAEVAMAAAVVRREAVAGPETARTAEELLDFAWREYGDGELLHTMQRHTPPATHPLEIYSNFAMAGLHHPPLERFVAHLAGLRAAAVPEHVPNRRLAVVAAQRRIGLPDRDDVPALVAQTWLGGTPEPWMLDTYNAYGVTHTVFHLTDWGRNPDGIDPRLQEYLHRWLPVWVEVFTETRSWDLLGELLAVDVCLSEPDWYPQAWEQLAAGQREDGMLPNGITRPSDDPLHAFTNHNHPTIVAAVAGTLTVSRALAVAS